MAKRRMDIIACFICIFLLLMPCCVQAVSTADAVEPIAVDKACTLTVGCQYDGTAFSNVSVHLYHVAQVSPDYQYTLSAPFADCGVTLNGVASTQEWDVIRSTLESHLAAKDISPATAVTDTEGNTRFNGLTAGLYLVQIDAAEAEGWIYDFHSTLVALPTLDEAGLWQYDVTVTAKAEAIPPEQKDEDIEYSLLKRWQGDGAGKDRPQSVTVTILRNGEPYRTVTLSEDNHWSYRWTAKKDGAHWAVEEQNRPQQYTVTVEEKDTAFVLTNTLTPDTPHRPDHPETGDSANIMLYVVLMLISGTVLVILALAGKGKRV